MTAAQLHFEGIKPRYFPWAARVDLMLRRAADGAAVTVDALTGDDRSHGEWFVFSDYVAAVIDGVMSEDISE